MFIYKDEENYDKFKYSKAYIVSLTLIYQDF